VFYAVVALRRALFSRLLGLLSLKFGAHSVDLFPGRDMIRML
jgi:hypothetical protein